MMHVLTASQLQLLCELYYSGERIALNSPHRIEAIEVFNRMQLIESRCTMHDQDGPFVKDVFVTERGKFYVEHLLSVPLPEAVITWTIPERT